MSFFVYVTEACQQSAREYAVADALDRLRHDIEAEQSLWRLQAFHFPFWVKKGLGNRHVRLISRLESHQIHGQTHEVLVFLDLYQRQDREYRKLYWAIEDTGQALYERLLAPGVVLDWLQQQLQAADRATTPEPSEAEYAFLYAGTVMSAPDPAADGARLYESWAWFEQALPHCDEAQLVQLAGQLQQLHQADGLAARTPLLTLDQQQQVVLYHFARHQASVLTVELPTGQGDVAGLDWARLAPQADRLDTVQFHRLLAQSARRCYGWAQLDSPAQWAALARSLAAHLVFSPEELDILQVVRQTRPFPLFINGRAGSGKSTILQHLFADYLRLALDQQQAGHPPLYPVYFTCNHTLSERAAELVLQIGQMHGHTGLDSAPVRAHCLEFRSYLLGLLPAADRGRFAPALRVDYGQFRRLWEKRFCNDQKARRDYPPSLCWHVIRSYIKGLEPTLTEPDDYEELGREQQLLPVQAYRELYEKVWEKWYLPLCRAEGYWDDQDLARHVLEQERVQPVFPAIFCDEAQDFTRIELDILLRLNVFSARRLRPDQIQQVPLVFAGDQFQTLNPTGFRWESVKAQVVEQFMFALDPAKHAARSELNYRELSFNFRSSQPITQFSNVVHGLRARLFGLKQMRPQQCGHPSSGARDVVLVDPQDAVMASQLARQFDLVFVLPCLDGQERDYIRAHTGLQAYLQLHEDGSTSIPAMSVIRAKGLEFQRVVLYGFGADCPADLDWQVQDGRHPERSIQHEYFLNRLYVGVTRARSQLLLIDDAASQARFWQPLQQAWEPPVNLQALPEAVSCWKDALGTLRPAELADITPDAGQLRSMQENAQQLLQQGLDTQDSYLLRQAAGLYAQLGDTRQQQYCQAEVLFLDQAYVEAGTAFEAIDRLDRAVDSYWLGLDWTALGRVLASPHLSGAERPALVAELVLLLGHLQGQRFPALARLLQQVLQQAQQNQLPVASAHRRAWQALLGEVLQQLPLGQPSKRWPELYGLCLQISQTDYFQHSLPDILLGELAYLAQDWPQACLHWERAREREKITPPFPRYAEAVAEARAFPDNLSALLALKRHEALLAQFQACTVLDQLPPGIWRQLLDALGELLNDVAFREVLSQKLPDLRQPALIQQLIEYAEPVKSHAAWVKRLKKLHLLHSCTHGDWPVVLQALQQQARLMGVGQEGSGGFSLNLFKKRDPKKDFKPTPELQILLYGLAQSQPYGQMTEGDRRAPEAERIMNALTTLFKVPLNGGARGPRASRTATHERIWRTDFTGVQLLGAVLERSGNHLEALMFYEALKVTQPEYAQARWLACKQRQANDAYRVRDYYAGQAEASVDRSTREMFQKKHDDMERRAEQYQQQWRQARSKYTQTEWASIPEYPELPDLQDYMAQLLQPPASAAAGASTAGAAGTPPVAAEVQPPQRDTTAMTAVLPEGPAAATVSAVDSPAPEGTGTLSVTGPETGDQPESVPVVQPEPEQPFESASAGPEPAGPDDVAVVAVAQPEKPVTGAPSAPEEPDPLPAVPEPLLSVQPAPPEVPLTGPTHQPEPVPEPTMTAGVLMTHHDAPASHPLGPDPWARSPGADPWPQRRLPTTRLQLLDYGLLVVRAQGRLNIEHQLTGDTLSVWPAQQRLRGDWPLHTDADTGLIHLQGTPLWLGWTADPHSCVIHVPEHGLQLQVHCGGV